MKRVEERPVEPIPLMKVRRPIMQVSPSILVLAPGFAANSYRSSALTVQDTRSEPQKIPIRSRRQDDARGDLMGNLLKLVLRSRHYYRYALCLQWGGDGCFSTVSHRF